MWLAAYQVMSVVKWLLWAGFIGYSLLFMYDRAPHLTPFGHLTLNAELFMFGLPLAAVIAGLFQLMLRERVYGEISKQEGDESRIIGDYSQNGGLQVSGKKTRLGP